MPIPNIHIDEQAIKGNYGKVAMKFISSFFIANGTILKKVGDSVNPMTFEEVGQENGFMLYETRIEKLFTDPAKLEIKASGAMFSLQKYLEVVILNTIHC